MSDAALQHTQLDGIADYTQALDTLCGLAQHELYIFEKNFDGIGFNSETRYQVLRAFLLANPANRLYLLTHDTRYLASSCARMTMLLAQFSSSMFIHQTPPNLRQISDPLAVADDVHFVRRFHFDDPRGILGRNDPSQARLLKSRFLEMWNTSHSGISASKLGL